MPKLKDGWLWRDNPTFMLEREARIRLHRERIEVESKNLGIQERGNALKQCCIEGCINETIECDRKRLRNWRWVKIDGKWLCPEHSPQQKEQC